MQMWSQYQLYVHLYHILYNNKLCVVSTLSLGRWMNHKHSYIGKPTRVITTVNLRAKH